MNKHYLERALNTAREMIRAYCVERNVEGVARHLSDQSFNFMGFSEENFFDTKEAFRKYAEESLPYTLNYDVVGEDYSVSGQSQDSCLVIAKITFMYSHTKKTFVLNYFFYFNLQDDQLVCTHYHVGRQFNMTKAVRLVYFNEDMPYPKLPWEIQAYNEDLLEFMNSDVVAEKSFYYKENMPYRLVNRKYMKLLGYSAIQDFIKAENSSSLVNVHEADRKRYVEFLANHFEQKIAGKEFEPQYKYHSTYYLSYRLQSPRLAEEICVLEWGNFFTQDKCVMVNCFVLNLNEAERISQKKKMTDSIRADFGIHISQNIIVYPRSRKLKIEGDVIEFTPIECEIFLVLADNLNQPISSEKIYEIIWLKSDLQLTSNVLPMHISNVRRKLAPYEHLVKVPYVRNEGYCLVITPI